MFARACELHCLALCTFCACPPPTRIPGHLLRRVRALTMRWLNAACFCLSLSRGLASLAAHRTTAGQVSRVIEAHMLGQNDCAQLALTQRQHVGMHHAMQPVVADATHRLEQTAGVGHAHETSTPAASSPPVDALLVHQLCLAEAALELQVSCIGLVEQRMVPADAVVLKVQEHVAGVCQAVCLRAWHSTAQHGAVQHNRHMRCRRAQRGNWHGDCCCCSVQRVCWPKRAKAQAEAVSETLTYWTHMRSRRTS